MSIGGKWTTLQDRSRNIHFKLPISKNRQNTPYKCLLHQRPRMRRVRRRFFESKLLLTQATVHTASWCWPDRSVTRCSLAYSSPLRRPSWASSPSVARPQPHRGAGNRLPAARRRADGHVSVPLMDHHGARDEPQLPVVRQHLQPPHEAAAAVLGEAPPRRHHRALNCAM